MSRFAQIPKTWSELLNLILESKTGRKTIEEFSHVFQRNQIEIKAYPEEIKLKLQASSPTNGFLGAVFLIEENKGTIYFDPQSEIGILAPFLIHEMTHCSDENLWIAARQKLTPFKKQELLFSSECRAFHTQHHFQEELKTIYPELRIFHLENYSHIPFLNRALLPDEIASMYKNIEK